MTTKEKIIEEALTLFSVNGYKGTSVKMIAEAVGIKDSSLYKHFTSKKEILNTIVNRMQEQIKDMSFKIGLPGETSIEEAARVFGALSEEGIVGLSKSTFLFYLTDPYVSRFWKMATMEQFHDIEVYQVYRTLFLDESITYQTAVFQKMSELGFFKETDPEVIAISFYSPIFFLLTKYCGQQGKEEEALIILEKQVREFYKIYRTDKD